MSANTKSICLFVAFIAAFGWAGSGDYEYRKHQEQKELARIEALKP
ncbi:MAG TPA: hypothetical protein PLJ88_11960 [Agitococcus sp.]|nr:hypothetical protein [Agitococcus sp.]